MKKRIVLCADDYGQAPAISRGILDLLQKGRLSATSCMVNTDYWSEHAAWLLPFQSKIDIGLHFNLTLGVPLSKEFREVHGEEFTSLGKVLRLAFMRSLSQPAIEAELHAQLDRFQEMLGVLPDHIDGHQHIHQFPVIRSAMVKVYEERLRAKNTYIRVINATLNPTDFIRHIKKVIVYGTGSVAMGKLLAEKGIPHNSSFAGIYAFGLSAQYPSFFPQFLEIVKDQGLIMCHPGLPAPEEEDLIKEARSREYQYLAGDQFLVDCRAMEVAIERLNTV